MRDSNYKSVSSNKAAVTITTSLYDRRALDVTSDKPLVNSLNHLTYLVSSLAKVRETLSMDGGIERLIEILHECHNTTFNLNDTIFNSEKKLLTAWKWTLTFQCLVLVGTRGTEKIRQKVVKAGILPIIATVLDNYLSLHERTFIHANSRPMHHHHTLLQQQCQHFQQQLQQRQNQADQRQDRRQQQNELLLLQLSQGISSQEAQQQHNSENGNPAHEDFTNNINLHNTFPNDLHPTHVELSDLSVPINAAAAAAVEEAAAISNSNGFPTFFSNSHPSNLTSEDYENLNVEQFFKLIGVNYKTNTINNDIRRRYLIVNIIKKLREEKETDLLDDRFLNDNDYEMDNNLQFLSDLYLQDHDHNRILMNAKIAPRNFTDTGVVIPRDDDIVWSLQLLAYISKYPYLKDILQNTHLVIDMSIRDKQLKMYLEKQMKLKIKKKILTQPRASVTSKGQREAHVQRFSPSASNSPQMLNDLGTLDNFILEEDKLELCGKPHSTGLTENAEIEDDSDEVDEEGECGGVLDDLESEEVNDYNVSCNPEVDDMACPSIGSNYLNKLYDSIIDAESIVNDMERDIKLLQLNERIEKYLDDECKKLSKAIIKTRKESKEFLEEKWKYSTYNKFDVDGINDEQDDSLVEYKKVNLFPMVEKFTFLSGTDMYYWSGVIMRNSCRRNEHRGGVRQCGNLECGKWEKFPREFLKCRRCKRTKYCSRECQMKAWHCHRNWCIPSNSSNTTTTTANQQVDAVESSNAPDDDSQRDLFSELS
ncbi:uncharacterized protein PRCAT00004989001 [Priceomyces carsonii]|uniref:uncharacterized protein n=1 Tax=Priceomyces carsonii TaxID=28549 RepID=UPI002EDA30B6|nr:unnamed protein product [Priceomyces carsonii]